MSWKKTDLDRLKAAGIVDRLRKSAVPARYGPGSAVVRRRDQRATDRARGLVPFAVKLNGELVKKVQARAQKRQAPLNQVVAELLEKGLDSAD